MYGLLLLYIYIILIFWIDLLISGLTIDTESARLMSPESVRYNVCRSNKCPRV